MSKPPFRAHLFVCTHQREKGESCAEKHSAELRAQLKDLCKADPQLKHCVRINSSGCLDQCSRGIAAVMYPQAQWFYDLKENDQEVLLQALRDAVKAREI